MRAARLLAPIPLVLLACGELSDVPPDGSCFPGGASFFPLAVGDWWHYRTAGLENGPTGDKVNVVVAAHPTSDGTVYEVDKLDSKPDTSWLLESGNELRWLRKLWWDGCAPRTPGTDTVYSPYRLRATFDPALLCTPGATFEMAHEVADVNVAKCAAWTQEDPGACAPTRQIARQAWRVLPPMEFLVKGHAVTAFCLNREDIGETLTPEGDFCYARGLGKVWEQSDQIEELIDFCLVGEDCPPPPEVDTCP